MDRRQFCLTGTAAALATWSLGAQAQSAPYVEGTHYKKLQTPVPVTAGKIDVVEFFSYACPHCNAFEPTLEGWVKKLPADVRFHRVPAPFLANVDNFQRIYYSLEAMNAVDAMQMKVFNAVHVEHKRLDNDNDIAALMLKNGIDPVKFMALFKSFGIQAKAKQGNALVQAFDVQGVPSLGVQGKFYAGGDGGTSGPGMLPVVDYLIQRVRAGA